MEHNSPEDFNKATFENACFISRSIRNPKLRIIRNPTHPTKLSKKCNIIVVKELCIFPYFELLNKSSNPLLLNIANEIKPGGDVDIGIIKQEEYLCCISSLYVGLRIAYDNELYPIKNPFILDNVIFFKDKPTVSAADILKSFYQGSVIVCPPLKLDKDEEIKKRIKILLETAATAGFRNLVLNSFKEDPTISQIFSHYLKETDIAYYFENIIFAETLPK